MVKTTRLPYTATKTIRGRKVWFFRRGSMWRTLSGDPGNDPQAAKEYWEHRTGKGKATRGEQTPDREAEAFEVEQKPEILFEKACTAAAALEMSERQFLDLVKAGIGALVAAPARRLDGGRGAALLGLTESQRAMSDE